MVSRTYTRLRGWLSLVRLRPFDCATPEGRSKERHRRVILSGIALTGAKAVNVLTMLIIVPLVLRYLGEVRNGVWITISALVNMLTFADLGIGNGLLNAMSEAHGRDDKAAAARYASSAFFLLAGIGAGLLLLFAAVYPFVPWATLFKAPPGTLAAAECGPAVAALMVCFAANMPLGVVQRIQAAHQEGFISGLWQAAGSFLSLAGLLVVIYFKGSLYWLMAASAGGPVIAAALNGIENVWRKPWVSPKIALVTRPAVRRIFQSGLLFLIVQVATIAAYQTDTLVITQVLGPAQVTQFGVPSRLFWLIPMVLFMFNGPLWPVYGEAIARGDVAWVKRTLRKATVVSMALALPPTLILSGFGKQIIGLWTQGEVTPSWSLLIAFGVWAISNSLIGTISMFFNGANVMVFQAVTCSLMAIANVTLSILLARAWGIVGVLYGTIISQTLFILIPGLWFIPRLLARLAAAKVSPAPVEPPPAITPALA